MPAGQKASGGVAESQGLAGVTEGASAHGLPAPPGRSRRNDRRAVFRPNIANAVVIQDVAYIRLSSPRPFLVAFFT